MDKTFNTFIEADQVFMQPTKIFINALDVVAVASDNVDTESSVHLKGNKVLHIYANADKFTQDVVEKVSGYQRWLMGVNKCIN